VAHPLISVFAIEDDAVQVMWRALPAPVVSFEIGGQVTTVEAGPEAFLRRRGRPPRPLAPDRRGCGGPGAVVIDGLAPSTAYDLTVNIAGGRRPVVERITTLPAPPGRLLSRFATISDLHIGERGFGASHTIEDVFPLPEGWESYTLRCARAAIDEALEWGAEAIIVKGDLTGDGHPVEFREVGRLLSGVRVPVEVTLGNHEFHDRYSDPFSRLADAGIQVPQSPWALDLPGVRVILGHSWIRQERAGQMPAAQRGQIVELAAEAPAAAFVALHHQPQRWRIANQYPPGIPGPEAVALLDGLLAANPATMVASGHTHRHRLHHHGALLAVEVGSTKDYPGTWAGYAVHEGGIRQVVRRVAAPAAITWTESTYYALGGVWGWWAPGAMSDRCFTHAWPAVPRRPQPSVLTRPA
jgi:3',5'-cyclic-AMP phosphodiesterase